MKSILFFIECLDLGGAEGILNTIVANISKEKFNVTVASERDEEFHTEEIKRNCRHKSFMKQKRENSKAGHFINSLIMKFSLLAPAPLVRKFLIGGNYDVEVAFCEGFSTKIIGNSKNRHAKKVAWIQSDVIDYPWSEEVHGSKENERKCYEKFDKIVCVSEKIKDCFVEKYGFEDKTCVLYNVIDSNSIIKKSNEPYSFPEKEGLNFVLVGSFKKVKGYDRFVKVCHTLKDEGYNFNVLIMGSGFEHDIIKNMISELGLNDMITTMEYQANPYKFIAKSDALICSSYAEGYSTTVIEAIVLGKPVITTECSGMREIFGDSECGIICPNSEEGLYNAMKSVLDNPEKLNEYSKNSAERANYFSIEKRIADIEEFFMSL